MSAQEQRVPQRDRPRKRKPSQRSPSQQNLSKMVAPRHCGEQGSKVMQTVSQPMAEGGGSIETGQRVQQDGQDAAMSGLEHLPYFNDETYPSQRNLDQQQIDAVAGPAATRTGTPDRQKLFFRDILHAEASQQTRTPLPQPMFDAKGSMVIDNVDEVVKDMFGTVSALYGPLEVYPPAEPLKAHAELNTESLRRYWTAWQNEQSQLYYQHKRIDDEGWEKAVEKRLWEVAKEGIAIHRNGYIDGLPADLGLSCIDRLQGVMHVLGDFWSVRAALADVTRSSINVPFLVANPTAYAKREMEPFWKWMQEAEAAAAAEASVGEGESGAPDADEIGQDGAGGQGQPPATMEDQPLSKKQKNKLKKKTERANLKTQRDARGESDRNTALKKRTTEIERLRQDGGSSSAQTSTAPMVITQPRRVRPSSTRDGSANNDGYGSNKNVTFGDDDVNDVEHDKFAPIARKGRHGASRKERKTERRQIEEAIANKDLNGQFLAQTSGQQQRLIFANEDQGDDAVDGERPRGRRLFAQSRQPSAARSNACAGSRRASTPGPRRASRARSQTPGRSRSEVRKQNEEAERAEVAKAKQDQLARVGA